VAQLVLGVPVEQQQKVFDLADGLLEFGQATSLEQVIGLFLQLAKGLGQLP